MCIKYILFTDQQKTMIIYSLSKNYKKYILELQAAIKNTHNSINNDMLNIYMP